MSGAPALLAWMLVLGSVAQTLAEPAASAVGGAAQAAGQSDPVVREANKAPIRPVEALPGVSAPGSDTPPASLQPLNEQDLLADEPPTGPYDLQRAETPLMSPGDPALIAQLGRTIVALVFVVALIYLCAKLLPRVFKQLPGLGSGQHLKVLERTQLDAKHTVVLLQVDETTRLLLGTGDGVHLLTTLTAPPSVPFRSTMSEAQRDATVS